MKIINIVLILVSINLHAVAQTLILDSKVLKTISNKISNGDLEYIKALDSLVKEAETIVKERDYSIVSKEFLPPSGDKHDYLSRAPYWWPDKTKPNGLPYIAKDGQHNPENGKIKDLNYLINVCRNIEI